MPKLRWSQQRSRELEKSSLGHLSQVAIHGVQLCVAKHGNTTITCLLASWVYFFHLSGSKLRYIFLHQKHHGRGTFPDVVQKCHIGCCQRAYYLHPTNLSDIIIVSNHTRSDGLVTLVQSRFLTLSSIGLKSAHGRWLVVVFVVVPR